MNKKYFLISHNEFAFGLKKALEMIVGKQDNLWAYGLMPGEHPDDIIAEIESQLSDETEAVILGDIAGGSVCNSAMRLTTMKNVVLITGVNLPLAMEIIISQVTEEQAIDSLVERTRQSMKIVTVSPIQKETDSDFF
ncbi:PTS sugar transporter subunit IIA [Candidatus Enterococcus clewellii]|uniref:PTS system, mannose-specific IIA component n=1 Tax=Candidatus Enterococcus clewellii TaxID=1834193 RepID=A0A242KCH5_9ENTE|nr:PTS mannose transporter subunit IIA [Enterococcus sp. 9E7_DIV0242]OTP18873.1 hypothetical protein A5888_000687 [Enterococcus sp. 9E7_DIV0242]